MKRTIFLILFLFSFIINAQNDDEVLEEVGVSKFAQDTIYPQNIEENELSLNVYSLLNSAIEVGYERILSEDINLGFDVFVKFLKDKDDPQTEDAYVKNLALTGRLKYFLSKRPSRGFYVQGFTTVSQGPTERFSLFGNEDGNKIEDYIDIAVGTGFGYKFDPNKVVFADLSLGFGRNLFHPDSPQLVLLINIAIGFRF